MVASAIRSPTVACFSHWPDLSRGTWVQEMLFQDIDPSVNSVRRQRTYVDRHTPVAPVDTYITAARVQYLDSSAGQRLSNVAISGRHAPQAVALSLRTTMQTTSLVGLH